MDYVRYYLCRMILCRGKHCLVLGNVSKKALHGAAVTPTSEIKRAIPHTEVALCRSTGGSGEDAILQEEIYLCKLDEKSPMNYAGNRSCCAKSHWSAVV